ncbi:outer membrane protein assembly factor BamE [Methylicorpusculum oleiharenae]|uniref:outer membrane protein assembly factor BamE n=1 Tax=Methylicorpusculum oleiharenae TaxID=1338687 RepID=UPI0013DE4297|nr:outer membrane protein assembly factor BamE [Methylicorpusculum oleiharenae]MCD2453212.1 outer membrane protein assembly factor BamE [Methylicorpusculum oleiharenae]
MKKSIFYPAFISASLTLTGCTTIMEYMPGVYKIDIQQGNLIDQEVVDQLRPGMNKRQVLYIMGSPMLIDVFNEDRWDYVYSEQEEGGPRMQKRLTLFFKEDSLKAVQGDFRPSSKPVERVAHETTMELPPRDLEKTLWEKITGLFGFDGLYREESTGRAPQKMDRPEDPLSSSSAPK